MKNLKTSTNVLVFRWSRPKGPLAVCFYFFFVSEDENWSAIVSCYHSKALPPLKKVEKMAVLFSFVLHVFNPNLSHDRSWKKNPRLFKKVIVFGFFCDRINVVSTLVQIHIGVLQSCDV